ncbi:MaoC family dehydratase N-terminal domain-containing protein [Microbacteriaceae bacterium K1510]|nr:MaoC family dehydratase N-terminal domain-containing protein [Microbacteriaceae bacterium K1510]
MRYLTNRTFDEIARGDRAALTRTLKREDIALFATVSGDINPAHLDAEFAAHDIFHHIVAHGMWGGALISALLGTSLPGPGTIYLSQTLRFRRPVAVGDTVTAAVVVREKQEEKAHVVFDCAVTNQTGDVVIEGEAVVIAPREKISRPAPQLPHVAVIEDAAGA